VPVELAGFSCLFLIMLVSVSIQARRHPWPDEALPDTERVAALIAAMTAEEQTSRLQTAQVELR
jgi:hypothetical protein